MSYRIVYQNESLRVLEFEVERRSGVPDFPDRRFLSSPYRVERKALDLLNQTSWQEVPIDHFAEALLAVIADLSKKLHEIGIESR